MIVDGTFKSRRRWQYRGITGDGAFRSVMKSETETRVRLGRQLRASQVASGLNHEI